ncbi:MAG: 2-hydroxychromene-2-carboxylate isomerase [Pseudomonadota bacterium]
MASVDFWFELASTYSYPAAMRIDGVAAAYGVSVRWRPFLLGPIFKSQGWDTSPFKVYPAKGRYMWRDMERLCQHYDLPFAVPGDMAGFPRHSVLAARVALVGLEAGWGRDFVKSACTAQFAQQADIADRSLLKTLVEPLVDDPEAVLAAATSPDIKTQLRMNTEEAVQRGLFGAPSFTVGDELFWGNDRLETAFDWASKGF